MKKITSMTLHTTSDGQRVSFTFSDIDETTGMIISENNRDGFIVLEIAENEEILQKIEDIKNFTESKMIAKYGL